MTRKRWKAKTEVTPSVLEFRDKRKWQIALRRYILRQSNSSNYAPYFGLDIKNIRKWIELQFEPGIAWDNFGKKWQIDHILPVSYFDCSQNDDLKLCWNFTNIRVRVLQPKQEGRGSDLLTAKTYFEDFYASTGYPVCKKIIEKIERIVTSIEINSERQQAFIMSNRSYLDMIENYSAFEFELLNTGRSIEEIKHEVEFFKKFEN